MQPGTRVALDMTTLTIMRHLPREVDPLVYNMSHEDPGDVTYNQIGGLAEQIRELREVSTLPFKLLVNSNYVFSQTSHILSYVHHCIPLNNTFSIIQSLYFYMHNYSHGGTECFY